MLRDVNVEGRRIKDIDLATRYGDIKLSATGFVDASRAMRALTWQAGFACRESAGRQVYGTQMVVLENINEAKHPTRDEMAARMTEKADKYQLVRKNAVSFVIPGRGVAALNMTHTETPLEPLAAAAQPARRQGAGRPRRATARKTSFRNASARRGCVPMAIRYPADPLDQGQPSTEPR